MDPPIINESSFSAANPSAYSLSELWPFSSDSVNGAGGGLGLRIGNFGAILENGSAEVSTVTEQSNGRKRKELCDEDYSSKMVSTSSDNELNNSNGKRSKIFGSRDESSGPKVEAETSSAAGSKQAEGKKPSEPPKDYIHVRARRGQATDSHSLAERFILGDFTHLNSFWKARREKISERMKILQDLVPGCNKVIGKAVVLDEIINYIQSLQRQVEFLSMKLEAVNARMSINLPIDGFPAKELGAQQFEASGMMLASQATREYAQGSSQPEWLHMQLGGSFERQS